MRRRTVTGLSPSTIRDTFGAQMLSAEWNLPRGIEFHAPPTPHVLLT
jgi:hypothetical protein